MAFGAAGDRDRIDHMLEAIATLDEVLADPPSRMTQIQARAVERCFEIISEASRRISDGLKETESGVEWRKVAGIGNILRHDYPGVDFAVLLSAYERDIPPLKSALLRMLARLP